MTYSSRDVNPFGNNTYSSAQSQLEPASWDVSPRRSALWSPCRHLAVRRVLSFEERYRGDGSALGMMVAEASGALATEQRGPMIEVWCVPGGTATAIWGPRVAVLADLGSAGSLASDLADLVARPDVGAAEVIGLLALSGGQVDDFAVAEELDDGRLRLVLRGQSASSVGGTAPRGGGIWRSRVAAAVDVHLYGASRPDSAAPLDEEPATAPASASSLRLRVAGRLDPEAPRRAWSASDQVAATATTATRTAE